MKIRTFPLIILFSLALIAAACQSPTPTAVPTAAPTPLPTKTLIPSPTPTSPPLDEALTSSPEALAACDLEKQALALLPDQLPDWNNLGIDTCYDLVFDLAENGSSYTGSARITYTNLTSLPLEDIVLRVYPNAPVIYGGALAINEARAGGQILQQESVLTDGSAVRLALAQPLVPQETLLLELTFTGQLPVDAPGEQTYGVFNLNSSGPIAMLANSYPMIAVHEGDHWRADPVLPEGDAVVSKIALYLVEIRAPIGWKVVSTGILLEQSQDAEKEVYQLIGGPVREFAWAASPAFEERNVLILDTFLQHWALPETETSWVEALQVSEDSFETFSETFGPYPYSELDVIALPLKNASGVEYPGLILMQSRLYTATDEPRLLPTVLAHEVSHQWWYGLVGNDVLRSPWQDEALATYSSQLYQLTYNPVFYEGVRSSFENRVDEIQTSIGEQRIAQPVKAFAGQASSYAVIVYQKGYLFFEALRSQIGDEAFYKALQEYYAANLYQIAAPDELLDSFETTCGCDLEGLYTEWGVR